MLCGKLHSIVLQRRLQRVFQVEKLCSFCTHDTGLRVEARRQFCCWSVVNCSLGGSGGVALLSMLTLVLASFYESFPIALCLHGAFCFPHLPYCMLLSDLTS